MRTQYGQERTSGEHDRDRTEHQENTIWTVENIREHQENTIWAGENIRRTK